MEPRQAVGAQAGMSADLLRFRLRRTIEPARRHRCNRCARIFECHLCVISADHPLHSFASSPGVLFYCLSCADRLRLDTILLHDSGARRYRMYSYATGAIVWEHRGWIHSQRSGKRGPNRV